MIPKFRVSSSLTASQVASVLKFVYYLPQPVSRVSQFVGIDNKKLLEFLETQHGKSFFITLKEEGLVWMRFNHASLINTKAQIKPISVERIRCIHRVMSIIGYCFYNQKTKKFIPSNSVYEWNRLDFQIYIKRISRRSLFLIKDPSKRDNFFAPPLVRPYVTRFTDKNRQKATQAQYYSMWEDAAVLHDKAVYLTLTIDPKFSENLWDANKHYTDALNNLFAFLKKRIKAEIERYPEFKMMNEALERGYTVDQNFLTGRRNKLRKLVHQQYARKNPILYSDFVSKIDSSQLSANDLKEIIKEGYKISGYFKDMKDDYKFQYINILEFQRNGRLHSHIVVFGLDYLLSKTELSLKWNDYGQGSIVDITQLKKNPSNPLSWTWKNSKDIPKDCRNRGPVDYLRGYLSKAQYLSSVNYWVFSTRFYTNSRNFEPIEVYNRKAMERKARRRAPKYCIYIKSVNLNNKYCGNVPYADEQESVDLAESLLVPAIKSNTCLVCVPGCGIL
jgi:hypothetical protein